MNDLLSQNDSDAVFNILVEQLGVERDQLVPDARIVDDLGADSLTVMEITMALEEHFGFAIPDEELERVATVADLFAVVAQRLAGNKL